MPKQKQFLKSQRKSIKPKDTIPRTANEFLAVGVDLEEAGEKWRAGDAQKSARFFLRALDNYENGLQRFPDSFDLAYNRARLQYEVAQQPRLLRHVPGEIFDLLRTALDSHRYALEISQENADLLFNTGQVLTSLGEFISEGRYRLHDAASADPLRLFQEAFEFFQRCLGLQELQLSRADLDPSTSRSRSMGVDERGSVTINKDESDYPHVVPEPSYDDSWATIVEPVTNQAIMDTLLAQVETLTSICGLLSTQGIGDPNWIQECYLDCLQNKLLRVENDTGRHHEAALAKAKYRCAVADANFNMKMLDVPTYQSELTGAYKDFSDSNPDPQALCDSADAEIVFAASLLRLSTQTMDSRLDDGAKLNIIRWKHLTKALDNLTIAGRLPNAENLPRIHLRRGDCELLRRRLGAAPWSYDIAAKSASTLLKNAGIFYRVAARLAKAENADDEEMEASTKEAIVIAASVGNLNIFRERMELDRTRAQELTEEMREDGLLGEEDTRLFAL